MSFILDIIFILLALAIMFLGYKKGFMHKALSLIGFLAILAISFAFCTQLAQIFKDCGIIYYDYYGNISNSIISGMGDSYSENTTAVELVASGLGYPNFVAKMIVSAAGISTEATGADVIGIIADTLAMISLDITCFFIIFVVSYIILVVLKILASLLRKVFVIRLIDGILGIVFYLSLYLLTMCVLLLILHYMIDASWFSGARDFFASNLQIDTGGFRLTGWLYDTNPLLRLFRMLGWA